MRPILRPAFLLALPLLMGLLAAPAPAQDFAGKIITIIVPYDAGGSTDLGARAISRYLPDYLPGHPTIIIRNMPGGGGLLGVNYAGEVARADGLTLLMWTWNPLSYLLKDPGLRVSMPDFRMVGGLQFGEVGFMRADVAPGMQRPADIGHAKKFWFGGLGLTNFKDLMGRAQLDLLGVDYEYITAYKGAQDLVNAITIDEIQFTTIAEPGWSGQVRPNLVDHGVVIPIFQAGSPNATGATRARSLPDIPTFDELYSEIHGKPPSGPLWQFYRFMMPLRATMADVVWLAPHTPDAITRTMRDALDAVAKLDAFMADYAKITHANPIWVSGVAGQKVLDQLANADPALVQALNDYAEAGRKKVRGQKP